VKSDGKVLILTVLNLAGFLGTVVVNWLANALPINNRNTGELSDLYPNLFVPAGLTFAIWGLIYLLLALFVIYQLLPSTRNSAQRGAFIERIGVLFFISSLANIGWIFAWHYELVALSLVLMLILLATLLAIYLRLRIGKSKASSAERYLVHLPFSVYLGWISVATIANVTALLVDINWDGFGLSEQFWAAAVIGVAIVLALAVMFTRRDIFYGLVVDWALLGILLRRLSMTDVPDLSVRVAAIAGMVIITVAVILQIIRRRVY
jgi:hypothetical protein